MILTWKNSAWDFRTHPPHLAILALSKPEQAEPISAIAQKTAERLPGTVFLLPTWPYAQSGEFSLGYQTLEAVVSDLISSLFQHGLSRVAVINGFGTSAPPVALPAENPIVKTAIRQLNYALPGLAAIWVQPFAAAREALARYFPEADPITRDAAAISAMQQYCNATQMAPGEEILDAAAQATSEYIQRTFDKIARFR